MSYSLSKQDLFVLHMMNGKIGRYLEIGANHPTITNNTYLLEKNGWTGISVDILAEHYEIWQKERINPLLIMDALSINFIDQKRIDYLQLDIEPPHQTFSCMLNMITTGCRFSIITYEHDDYTGTDMKQLSRDILESEGYYLAVPDVQCSFGSYEDWWIDKSSDIDLELLKTWNEKAY
jgi:hypothetical protein